jgi:hypothetical protein
MLFSILFYRRPIYDRVYFMNGENRSIEFDAAATCEEVCLSLYYKPLKNAVDFIGHFQHSIISLRGLGCL